MVRWEAGGSACVCVCVLSCLAALSPPTPRPLPPRSRAGIKDTKTMRQAASLNCLVFLLATRRRIPPPTPSTTYKYAKGCYSLLHKNFIKRAGSTWRSVQGTGRGGGGRCVRAEKRMKPIKLNFSLKSWKIQEKIRHKQSK